MHAYSMRVPVYFGCPKRVVLVGISVLDGLDEGTISPNRFQKKSRSPSFVLTDLAGADCLSTEHRRSLPSTVPCTLALERWLSEPGDSMIRVTGESSSKLALAKAQSPFEGAWLLLLSAQYRYLPHRTARVLENSPQSAPHCSHTVPPCGCGHQAREVLAPYFYCVVAFASGSAVAVVRPQPAASQPASRQQ